MINKKFKLEMTLGKSEGVAFGIIPILGLILMVFLHFHNPIGNKLFPKCYFLELTGFYCPGCGATRATYYLSQGNIIKAFSYNQLYVIFLPFMVYLYILNLGIKINGKKLMKTPKFSWIFYVLLLSIFTIFFILRNIHYYPFTLLVPY